MAVIPFGDSSTIAPRRVIIFLRTAVSRKEQSLTGFLQSTPPVWTVDNLVRRKEEATDCFMEDVDYSFKLLEDYTWLYKDAY